MTRWETRLTRATGDRTCILVRNEHEDELSCSAYMYDIPLRISATGGYFGLGDRSFTIIILKAVERGRSSCHSLEDLVLRAQL
jgi:hypothetical protein